MAKRRRDAIRRSSPGLPIQTRSAKSRLESPKSSKRTSGDGECQEPRVGAGDGFEDLADLRGVRPVRDADPDGDAQVRRRHRMVYHLPGHELAVGHDDGHLVARHHVRRAHSDVHDRAAGLPYLDEVAACDGPLDQKDQPRYEVLRDVLQAEPDADQQHRRRGEQRIEAHADRHHGDQRADEPDEVSRDLREREPRSLHHLAAGQNAVQPSRGEPCDEIRGDDDEEGREQGSKRERPPARRTRGSPARARKRSRFGTRSDRYRTSNVTSSLAIGSS